jgi:hypothetical protein
MAVTKRARAKGTKAAADLLPTGSHVRAYAIGRAHARLTTGSVVVGGAFLIAVMVALMLGYVLLPGGLLVLFLFREVRPPRAVVVADMGLTVMNRSFWNGRPSRILAALPPAPLPSPGPVGSVTLQLGSERITLSRPEFDVLNFAAMAPPA